MDLEWVPYELHPEVPAEGMPREAILPAAYRARVEEGVRRLGAEVGLRLVPHDRLINSRRALQAAEHARSQGRYTPMHRELFVAYWDQGRDISDMAVLREVAGRADLDPQDMEETVRANTYGALLDARRAEAEELMISGIPAHVIGNRFLVMGAQPYETFVQVMTRLQVPHRPAGETAPPPG